MRVLLFGEDVETRADGNSETSGEGTEEGREDIGAEKSRNRGSGVKKSRGTFGEGDKSESCERDEGF